MQARIVTQVHVISNHEQRRVRCYGLYVGASVANHLSTEMRLNNAGEHIAVVG
jgi:hypothetical protein